VNFKLNKLFPSKFNKESMVKDSKTHGFIPIIYLEIKILYIFSFGPKRFKNRK